MRDTYILYTYKYRRLETSPLISHECHTKSLRKLRKNTLDRHGNNGFVKHTKFPTRFICYGKFLPHFKTKKSNNIQIFANPTGLATPPFNPLGFQITSSILIGGAQTAIMAARACPWEGQSHTPWYTQAICPQTGEIHWGNPIRQSNMQSYKVTFKFK